MKTDIAKLDVTIAKLQEFRRLASDPAIQRFVEVNFRGLVQGDRPIPSGSNRRHKLIKKRGNLGKTVLSISQNFRRSSFTVKDVLARMQSGRFRFGSLNPEKSIANALRALVQQKKIRIVFASAGNLPTKYSAGKEA